MLPCRRAEAALRYTACAARGDVLTGITIMQMDEGLDTG
jgi:methionyl-tRNA formyltransferase